MDLRPLNLQVDILGYGPTLDLGNGITLTPEELIAFSSMMTYKDKNAKEMIMEIINSGKDVKTEAVKSLKESAKRGHASLSTSAAFWYLVRGASKFVDSMFTGAVYSSSLMPSGRRIPVNLENIVAPDSIINANGEIKGIYYDASAENIKFFMEIQDTLVKKEDAAKITQYGISGGGFMLIPLETLLDYKKTFEIEDEFVPKEGKDFVKLLEGKLPEMGMAILYDYRDDAPRGTLPYPNVFKDPEKDTIIDFFSGRLIDSPSVPILLPEYFYNSRGFMRDMIKLTRLREEITKSPEDTAKRWRKLLALRQDIINRHGGNISLNSFSSISWRVWGEVKRHRTLEQNVESVYAAADRAIEKFKPYREMIKGNKIDENLVKDISSVFMIPQKFNEHDGLMQRYLHRFSDSLIAYGELKARGIPMSDAIMVVPRGLKLMTFKRFDLYNILEGYIPLRLCGTAENEMRAITEIEFDKMRAYFPDYVAKNIGPKCASVGFCMEKKPCGKIQDYIGYKYTPEVHKIIHQKI
ncbi:FAD-dependent thymidylate synthase [Candidatus Woesearchaeota archaeon]|nr:FAD-dependent thymidylate synthase [Candidatus Woesearchaeota archaeon]